MCHVNRDSLTHCSQGSVAQLVEQRTSNPKVVVCLDMHNSFKILKFKLRRSTIIQSHVLIASEDTAKGG